MKKLTPEARKVAQEIVAWVRDGSHDYSTRHEYESLARSIEERFELTPAPAPMTGAEKVAAFDEWAKKAGRFAGPSEVTRDMRHACAAAGHETVRHYSAAHGDMTGVPWEQIPEFQQESSMAGVEFALGDVTAEQQHESWLAERRRTGWKLGPVKDVEKREHPCMVPFSGLPEWQQRKAALWIETVQAMARSLRGVAAPVHDVPQRRPIPLCDTCQHMPHDGRVCIELTGETTFGPGEKRCMCGPARVWLCALKRFLYARDGSGDAYYLTEMAEEIARVLTELGQDAEVQ
jgi:hypothetical protein